MTAWFIDSETEIRFKRSLGSIGARIDEVHEPNHTEPGIRKRICFQLLSVSVEVIREPSPSTSMRTLLVGSTSDVSLMTRVRISLFSLLSTIGCSQTAGTPNQNNTTVAKTDFPWNMDISSEQSSCRKDRLSGAKNLEIFGDLNAWRCATEISVRFEYPRLFALCQITLEIPPSKQYGSRKAPFHLCRHSLSFCRCIIWTFASRKWCRTVMTTVHSDAFVDGNCERQTAVER